MPISGDPDTLVAAADALARAATSLDDDRVTLGGRGRAMVADWSGTAAPLALARVEQQARVVGTVADLVGRAAGPLRTYAEELRRAQADAALGEQMSRDGAAGAEAVGSGAVPAAAAAREEARQLATDGAAVVATAEERALRANEVAARALAEASADLAGLVPPPPPPPDGDLGDGLAKAGEDIREEVAGTVSGVVAHLNFLDDDFGATWASTAATAGAVVRDPLGAVATMATETFRPLAESYASGGLDEAIGRAPSVVFGLAGLKGAGALKRVDAPEEYPSSPVAPGGGLQAHEDAGGHTLDPRRAHVGATPQEMFDRIQNSARPLSGVSSFTDRATAERSVAENVAANKQDVDAWLQSGAPSTAFEFDHTQVIGQHLDRGAASPDDVTDATVSRVVLKRDPNSPTGYFVLTAYLQPTR